MRHMSHFYSSTYTTHQQVYIQVVWRYRNAQMNAPISTTITSNVYKQTPSAEVTIIIEFHMNTLSTI